MQQAGLGLKKIKFFVDDSEEEVTEKLTSDVPGDDGLPTGFPLLKEGKGFQIMSCVTNSCDLAVIKSFWSVLPSKQRLTYGLSRGVCVLKEGKKTGWPVS